MNHKLNAIALSLALTLLAGCNQRLELVDGKIPQVLLESAQKWTGSFTGSMALHNQTITLSLDGERAVLEANSDLTGDAACQSQVGDLSAIIFRKKQSQVVELEFKFTPGHCFDRIEGRTLLVQGEVSKDGSVSSLRYTIYRDSKPEYFCEPDTNPIPNPVPGSPGVRCGVRRVARYIQSGQLVRN